MRRLLSWVKFNLRSRSPAGLRCLLAFAFLLLWSAPTVLRGASFTATLDREKVTAGETATLTLTFKGGDPKTMPSLPSLPNLHITGTGTARNISIDNGAFSASTSQTFALTPTQSGVYVIPALKAEVDGQVLTTQPLKLTAVKASTAATPDNREEKLAFFKLFLPKKEVYVGEVLAVEFQVFVHDGLANGDNILQSFDQYGGCPLKAEGVSILKTAHAQRRRGRIGNADYRVATLVTTISPIKTGPLTLGSMDVNLTLQIPLPNQRRRDPFDPFGMFQRMQVEERRVALAAEPETLTVLPLPKENIPADFKGAVGSFSMILTAGPTNVAAGDPVTVKVQISGHGAFDSLALPEQNAWREFKTYPPTSKVETTDALGLQGSKTFEQVVVPQSPEIKALPPVSFSFFDPDQKRYRTLTQPAVALIVRPGGSAPAPTVAAASRAAPDNPPPAQDIVHIKPRLGTVAQIAPPLVQQPWFLALQAIPVVAWLSA
ncbi:MAG: BatD family protein, partial [Verrucomicrobia bacterium]|nr:BatD family protein [Verrucomicrobiota bacterium]